MFFEIISPSGTKSYLLGTMHINDKEIVSLPLEIKKAFDNASIVVFEIDASQVNMDLFNDYSKEWMKKYHTEKSPLIFDITQAIVKADPKRFENSLDKQLLNESKQRRKQIGFLENVDDLIKNLMGYNLDEFEHAIYYELMVANHRLENKNIIASLNILKGHYLAINLNALSEHEALSVDAPEIAYKYNKSLISDWDSVQAEAMKVFMEQENAFFAVGAMHLLGITNKLKAEGYLVTQIPLGERVYSISGNANILFTKSIPEKQELKPLPVLKGSSV